MVRECLSGLVLAFIASCSPDPAGISGSAASLSAAASQRPSIVPRDFVPTPNGWFHPTCIARVGADERVRADGILEHHSGRTRAVPACAYPHYDRLGRAVDERAPTINSWVENASQTNTPLGYLSATWQVPASPTNQGSQTDYFFPGAEATSSGQTIIQPVLGWHSDFAGWGIASWNCCKSGTTYESSPLPVNAGDSITGWMQASGCSGGVCNNWQIVTRDNTTSAQTTLNTGSWGQAFNWTFGGVLEAYGIDDCGQYPANGSISFSSITAHDTNGAGVSVGSWSTDITSGAPQCDYAVRPSGGTVVLNWAPEPPLLAGVGAARNSDGRLEVFAIGTDHQMYHAWQITPGGGWTGFYGMGGWFASGAGAAVNKDGRLEVFGVGSDNQMYHAWQIAPGGGWTGWNALGGDFFAGAGAATNTDSRLEVFGVGSDKQMYHAWQTSPGGGWTGWNALGGDFFAGAGAGRNADGRLELFAIGGGAQMYHIWQTSPGGAWSAWSGLSGGFHGGTGAATNADGRLEVIGIGTDNAMYHDWQTSVGGGWAGWYGLGGGFIAGSGAATNSDGRLESFGVGTNNRMFHAWQTSPGSGWTGWYQM